MFLGYWPETLCFMITRLSKLVCIIHQHPLMTCMTCNTWFVWPNVSDHAISYRDFRKCGFAICTCISSRPLFRDWPWNIIFLYLRAVGMVEEGTFTSATALKDYSANEWIAPIFIGHVPPSSPTTTAWIELKYSINYSWIFHIGQEPHC